MSVQERWNNRAAKYSDVIETLCCIFPPAALVPLLVMAIDKEVTEIRWGWELEDWELSY
jgi:hypothetical protein